jgi:phage-related protein
MGLEFDKGGALLSPLPESMEVVLGLMKQKFGGMMDAQSKTFEGMMSNLNDWVGGTLRTIGQPIFEILREKLQGLLQFLTSPGVQAAITGLATGLADGIGGAITFLTPIITNLITFIGQLGTTIGPVITTIANFVSGLISGGAGASAFGTDISNTFLFVQGIVSQVVPLVTSIVENGVKLIAEFWDENGDEIIAFVQDAWKTIVEIINLALELYQAIVVPILTTVAKFIAENGDQIKAAFKTAWDIISGIIRFAMDTIKTVISLALAVVKGDTQSASNILQNIWTNLRNAISDIVNGIASSVSGKFNEIKNNITGAIQSAFDTVNGMVTQFVSIGAGIMDSIVSGIRNAAEGLFNALRSAVLGAIEGALSIFPPFIQDAIRSIINPGGGRSGAAVRIGSSINSGSFARGGASASGSTFVFNIDARGSGASTAQIEQAVDRAMLTYGRRADTRIRTA